MPLINMKQVQGGKELQGNVSALLDTVGKDKYAFFNEMLNWLLSEAPENFDSSVKKDSRLFLLVNSILANSSNEAVNNVPYLSFVEENKELFTLKTRNGAKNWDGTLEYSTDTSNWLEWNGEEISSSNDGRLFLRGSGNTFITGEINSGKGFFLTSEKNIHIHCLGNIENLLDYKIVLSGDHPTMAECCYDHLFTGNYALIVPPELPAIKLTTLCYGGMFENCGELTSAPELPATELAAGCYKNMFGGCTALTAAPELPATELIGGCYSGMFVSCISLVTAPKLPAAELKVNCYNAMFTGCTSLKAAPELPAISLANSCYTQMFDGCTSLEVAPSVLPASSLPDFCYKYMFRGCKKLTGTIHCPASTSSSNNRLDANTDNLPANTATVVYDL